MAAEQPGLRERKKQKTRELIADTARRLFAERGFDAVSVVEIARAADVSEKTVYNYFPTKEDLVYGHMESYEERLLEAVRERQPGESVLTVFGDFLRETAGAIAEIAASGELKTIARVITSSPALLAREQQVFAHFTESLATLLAEESGAKKFDMKPWVAANALVGIHRAQINYVRQRALAEKRSPTLARDLEAQTKLALDSLARGLEDFPAKKPAVRRKRRA